jgi:hypothetical protein
MACMPEHLSGSADHISDANAIVSKQHTLELIVDTYLSRVPASLQLMTEKFNVQLVKKTSRLAWVAYRIS